MFHHKSSMWRTVIGIVLMLSLILTACGTPPPPETIVETVEVPGETVVEAGCGWGALALHMARRYGVRVLACNLSRVSPPRPSPMMMRSGGRPRRTPPR